MPVRLRRRRQLARDVNHDARELAEEKKGTVKSNRQEDLPTASPAAELPKGPVRWRLSAPASSAWDVTFRIRATCSGPGGQDGESLDLEPFADVGIWVDVAAPAKRPRASPTHATPVGDEATEMMRSAGERSQLEL